jgi:hypothetical protein
MLKRSTLGIIAAFVVLNGVIAIIAFLRVQDRDLSIPDTVVEFEQAAYGGNFEALWDLSTSEYRQGRTQAEFIEWARQNTPAQDRIFDWTVLNERTGDFARAHILVQLASGEMAAHRMLLERTEGRWRVSDYTVYEGDWPPVEPPLSGT